MRRIGEIAAASTAAVAVFALTFARPQAHKPITSKYTYNDDVFPIVSERCGGCHGPNGAAPMSLLTYQETVPWAESIREELVAERMPPWFVDPRGPSVRAARAITAREIDTLVTWATGGTPEGNAAKRPVPKRFWMLRRTRLRSSGWPSGCTMLFRKRASSSVFTPSTRIA